MSLTSQLNLQPTHRASRVRTSYIATSFRQKSRYTMDSHILRISHNGRGLTLHIRQREQVLPARLGRQTAEWRQQKGC